MEKTQVELPRDRYPIAAPLFAGARYGVLAAGTLEGEHPGRVFSDRPEQPSAALVATRVGHYFLAGSPADATLAWLRELFITDLIPAQLSSIGDPQFLLFYDSPAWQVPLLSLFAERGPAAIYKKRMVLGPGALARQGDIPTGLRLAPIDAQLASAHPDLEGETTIFWGSPEAFTQKSLGFCVLDGSTLASYCLAVFIGAGEAEISVSTTPGYRRRGLARLAASAFLEACLARGLKPIWGCWPENEPSIALAKALGFVDDADQPALVWEEPSVATPGG